MADKKKVSWIDSSDPSIYHFFSPFKQHGLLNKAEKVNKNWQVSLENGWMKPEKNSRLDRQGTYRMLIGPDGRPYTAPNGPARGKFIAFDAWQSNDELMTIYKKAFEEPYEEGYADAIDYTGMARTGNKQAILQNWKGDGHIKEVSYNSSFECMMVNFENKDAVVCYLGVPQGTIDMLRQCVGQTVAGRGKHNHLLGIKFWDYVRIRGTKHGSRYPFWYVTDAQGHTYESTVSKLKQADVADYMKKLQASNTARLNKWSIARRGAEEYIVDLDVIFSSPRFKQMYDSGDEIAGIDIDSLNNLMDDYNQLSENGNSDKQALELVGRHRETINKLRKMFSKEIADDWKLALPALQQIEKEGKQGKKNRESIAELRAKKEQEELDNSFDPNYDYDNLIFPNAASIAAAKANVIDNEPEWSNFDKAVNEANELAYAKVKEYDRWHPQTKAQVANGIGRGTNWRYNYNGKSYAEWKKTNGSGRGKGDREK